MVSKKRFWPFIAIVAALAACGGGGSGGGSGGLEPTPMPTSTSTSSSANVTTASGTVVNDATGATASGVRVVLMPWSPCGATPAPASSITPENDGCPTPLPSPQVTTDPSGKFVLGAAPNGHYVLVIGSDATSSAGPVQATVHDNVTLSGGSEALRAPILGMPSQGYSAPAWETNGDYRLAVLDAVSEQPCFVDWQNGRIAAGVAAGTVDEWALENVRAVNGYFASGGNNSVTSLLLSQTASTNGGTDCSALLGPQFTNPNFQGYISDPRDLWFGGQFIAGGAGAPVTGLAEMEIDPRSYVNPNFPSWP